MRSRAVPTNVGTHFAHRAWHRECREGFPGLRRNTTALRSTVLCTVCALRSRVCDVHRCRQDWRCQPSTPPPPLLMPPGRQLLCCRQKALGNEEPRTERRDDDRRSRLFYLFVCPSKKGLPVFASSLPILFSLPHRDGFLDDGFMFSRLGGSLRRRRRATFCARCAVVFLKRAVSSSRASARPHRPFLSFICLLICVAS